MLRHSEDMQIRRGWQRVVEGFSMGELNALAAGGIAGLSVDCILFPLDTIKTRLQSRQGFRASGGWNRIYKGISSAAIASVPSASTFFFVYESAKAGLKRRDGRSDTELAAAGKHMLASSLGEISACVIRVPAEVIKQRMQTQVHPTLGQAVGTIYAKERIFGFYRGYMMTIFREIPFACVQFPLFEFLKKRWSIYKERPASSLEVGLCGSIAGGVAAAVTTPLDVAKTRIMLSPTYGQGDVTKAYASIPSTFRTILRERGVAGLFSGIAPRVTWISIGGSIFLGVYDFAKRLLDNLSATS
ncbi:mitochondrial carrier domain-containing protein [Cladochytrium replicatum]|nr:mitochondrial carrier domain-containing protein [Cladochytrium replicatum]